MTLEEKEATATMETLIPRRTPHRSWARLLGTGAAVLLAAGTVAASAGTAGAASSPAAPSGATGSVAALSGTSMEVQNASTGQTTVNWTTTTTFSKSATEAVSAITVGDCVTATGSASKKSKTTIAARNLTVSTPSSSGTCGGVGGGGPGAFRIGTGSGAPPAGGFRFRGGSAEGGTRPSFPTGGRAGNFAKQFANLAIASGKVTAVNGSTLTVSGVSISGGNFAARNKTSKSKTPTKPKTETLKVTTSSSTPVNTTQTVSSTALAVGDCVSAFGPAATNGSVTATTVRITSTGGGTCTGGFGGPGGGGFFRSGGPGGSGA